MKQIDRYKLKTGRPKGFEDTEVRTGMDVDPEHWSRKKPTLPAPQKEGTRQVLRSKKNGGIYVPTPALLARNDMELIEVAEEQVVNLSVVAGRQKENNKEYEKIDPYKKMPNLLPASESPVKEVFMDIYDICKGEGRIMASEAIRKINKMADDYLKTSTREYRIFMHWLERKDKSKTFEQYKLWFSA